MKINHQLTADSVAAYLRAMLSSRIGDKVNLEDVKRTTDNALSELKNRRIIVDFKTGAVNQLWNTWSWKQKIKWRIYNELPILSGLSNEYRKLVDEHNALVSAMDEAGINFEYGMKELPDHLISGPKTIILSDIIVKPNVGIDHIVVNIDIKADE